MLKSLVQWIKSVTHISIQTSLLHKPQKLEESLLEAHRSTSVSSAQQIFSNCHMVANVKIRESLNYTDRYIHIEQCQSSQHDRNQHQDSSPSESTLKEKDAQQLHKHVNPPKEVSWECLRSDFPWIQSYFLLHLISAKTYQDKIRGCKKFIMIHDYQGCWWMR